MDEILVKNTTLLHSESYTQPCSYNYKELEIILSDFSCDKHCPYCTAKITQWPKVKDDIHLLSLYVGQFKELGYKFHYVTIGGNGEPTLHSYEKLKDIVEMFDDYDIPVKRVLTSGNIFRKPEKEKYDLFVSHGWMFEVTTTSFNNKLDRKILGYEHNYFETEAFKNARIRLNYVLLKNNIGHFIEDIKNFNNKYPNIETFALKLLNVNTKTGEVDNPLSSWIIKNAISKTERDYVASILNSKFQYNKDIFDACSWKMDDNHEIYFSWKKGKYGLHDLVWYGDKFVNYQLEEVSLPKILPKVYIASKFMKENINRKLSFKNDFRTKLIGNENDFVDFNNHSFIRDSSGNLKYQYLGPFYNEKASDGSLTSSICEEVVQTENELIDKCDIFIVYFDSNISPGSITELIYAAFKKKKIEIYYVKEDDISYELKSSNWYPIVSAIQITKAANSEARCATAKCCVEHTLSEATPLVKTKMVKNELEVLEEIVKN